MSYTTAAQVRQYQGIGKDDDDSLINALILRAQKAIENRTSRVFEGSAADRTFDAIRDVDGRMLWFDEDLASIVSVTNGDSTSVSASDYVTEPRNHAPYYALKLKDNATVEWTYTDTPEGAITVNGVWAFSATAPADIVHATVRLAAYYYRQKDSGTFDVTAIPGAGVIEMPIGIPKDVDLILGPYKKLVGYGY